MLIPNPSPGLRAQAPGQDNATLVQFLGDAFSAAQKSGAGAILPYEFVPHAYAYDASAYAFGTDSAAYTSSVAPMYTFQAQRVNPDPTCPAWCWLCVPQEHVTALHPKRDTTSVNTQMQLPVADTLTPAPCCRHVRSCVMPFGVSGRVHAGRRPTCRHAPSLRKP